MRIAIIVIFLIAYILVSAYGQDCKKLENGKYKVKSKGYDSYILSIDNENFTVLDKNAELKKGKIEWDTDVFCIFVLNYEENIEFQEPDTLKFDYIHKGWGKPCYELLGINKFRMTWTGNLHITLYEGKIIKMKD